jgi:hypothetical protein
MKKNCRFKLLITKGLWKNNFQCAADPDGWAWSYSGSKISNPCEGCDKCVEGEITEIDHWLKSDEFWKISGKLIRAEDWEFWKTIKG